MIDLHCHILPEVDDGAASEEESCLMARMAADSGITALAATPHCGVPGQFENFAGESLLEKFHAFAQLLERERIPLRLYTGMEVFVTEKTPRYLREGRLLTLGDSRYLLVEFGFDEEADFAERMLGELLEAGVVPVVAHPERYHFIQPQPERLLRWVEMGCALQVNKGSLLGRFGRRAARTAHWCLGEGCVHLLGSDAHSPWRRTPRMEEAWAYTADFASPEIADFLLRDNPRRILEDQPVRPVLAEF